MIYATNIFLLEYSFLGKRPVESVLPSPSLPVGSVEEKSQRLDKG